MAFFPLPLSLQTSSFAANLAARTQGGVHKDDKDCVDDSIIPPLPEAGLQELQKETTSMTTSSGPGLWPSDSDITHPLPEEDDSQSEAELQEAAKKETTVTESFECPLWLKRLAQKISTGGNNKQHNLRQIWGVKMPPQPPPPRLRLGNLVVS